MAGRETSRTKRVLSALKTSAEIAAITAAVRGPAPPPHAPPAPPTRTTEIRRTHAPDAYVREYRVERDLDHLADHKAERDERLRESAMEMVVKPDYSDHRPPPDPKRSQDRSR